MTAMFWLKPITFALLPVIAVQGYRVKKNIIRLDEPQGSRQGVIGEKEALSILILGDSAAAGVGVEHQNQALLGVILKLLAPYFRINYCLEAQTGRTTNDVLTVLKNMENQCFDIVITSLGVNDVTKLTSVRTWMKQQKKLYKTIEEKLSPQLVLVTAVPPMQHFPALPQPLGWLFGQYSTAMNQQLKPWLDTQKNYHYIPFDLAKFQHLNLSMAKDGFHPSEDIYALWGQAMIEKIQQHFLQHEL